MIDEATQSIHPQPSAVIATLARPRRANRTNVGVGAIFAIVA